MFDPIVVWASHGPRVLRVLRGFCPHDPTLSRLVLLPSPLPSDLSAILAPGVLKMSFIHRSVAAECVCTKVSGAPEGAT